MSDFYSDFSNELKVAIQSNNRISCDKCSGIMVERKNERGSYLSCGGCRNFKPIDDKNLSIKEVKNILDESIKLAKNVESTIHVMKSVEGIDVKSLIK